METKKAIREELLQNPNADRAKLAIKYGVNLRNVGAVYASINRRKNEKTKKKKGKTNTYTNHNGINKEQARNIMINHIIYSGVKGSILTLPNTTWAIEQKINKAVKGISFLAVENNKETFLAMRKAGKKLSLNFNSYFGNISDFIYGKTENTYAHLLLDYCGELPKICKEVEYAINSNIVSIGGVIAITFTKQIRGSKNSLLGEKILSLVAKNNNDKRCETERAAEAYFNKITPWNYQILEFNYYQDKGHTPMALVIIKRLN